MIWVRFGSFFLFIAVALGAFGAHALKNKLSPDMLAVFETGVRYQFYHALGLLFVAWFSTLQPRANLAGWAFTIGILIFSGSLYALSLTGVRIWGAVTPIGGLAFLAGWLILVFSSSVGR